MPSQGNFVLPGIAHNPLGLQILIAFIILAYSGTVNPRRLEDPLYIFWDKVLQYLVFDLEPHIAVGPQLKIYEAAWTRAADGADDSMVTLPGELSERIPDFTLLCTFLAERAREHIIRNPSPHTPFENWSSMKVVGSRPFSFAEVKRMSARHVNNQTKFQYAHLSLMDSAQRDAENQAEIAFNEQAYNLDTIILIAAVGEWWCFKFAHRPSSQPLAFFDALSDDNADEDQDQDDEDDKDADPDYVPNANQPLAKAEQKKANKRGRSNKPSASQKRNERTPVKPYMVRFKDIAAEHMEVFKSNVQDARPKRDRWSNNIRFGTEASNQRFFLIHEELKKMRDAFKEEVENRLAEGEEGQESDDTEASGFEE